MKLMVKKVVSTVNSFSRHLLAASGIFSPVELGLYPTHVMCNICARQILEQDYHSQIAQLLKIFQSDLDLGVCWPDSDMGGLGCVHHFYHAKDGTGLLGRTPANVFCRRYFLQAINLWRQGKCKKAMFFLGAASHFIQDICEPHHSSCDVGRGHHGYEDWVAKHKENYITKDEGIYWNYQEPDQWIKECAGKSYELFDLVTEKSNFQYYRQATEYLLPFTQQVTAGFIYNFFRQVGLDKQQYVDLKMLRAD